MKFAKFVKEEYAPQRPRRAGHVVASRRRRALRERRQAPTTTTISRPRRSTSIGLEQVAAIERRDDWPIAKKLGFSDLKALAPRSRRTRSCTPTSREEILDRYRKYIDQMKPKLPKLFGRLPKADVVVDAGRGVPREGGLRGAVQPGHAGRLAARPRHGQHVRAREPRKTISTESTAYHEGVPGPSPADRDRAGAAGLPPFRQQACYTAFVEGWALYSERLGKEVGFYQDPYSDYGRLQDEMLRAIRLVVDTGFHYKQWTREQVVEFFHAHSRDRRGRRAERDRPLHRLAGAGAGYKIGQLKILELRERAKKALGDRVRHPRVPRRGPGRRRPAARRARGADRRVDRGEEGRKGRDELTSVSNR